MTSERRSPDPHAERRGRPGIGTAPVALLVTNLSKTFAGQRALQHVDLTVGRGEVHALIGHNGSGKSTLVKTLAGVHDPDPDSATTVIVEGHKLELGSPKASRAASLRFVHQDLGLVGALSVSDNFFLDDDKSRPWGPLNRGVERATVAASLEELGYIIDPDVAVATLSESERTIVALGRALHGWETGTGLVVLDEVTAAMPSSEATRLFVSVRELAARGTGVLFISHDLLEVLSVADVITVFRDGRRVATKPAYDLDHDALVELMLGRSLAQSSRSVTPGSSGRTRRVLKVAGLKGTRVRELTFDLDAGQVIGVAGLTGSGREDVASLLAGAATATGRIEVEGCSLSTGDPALAVDMGICHVPANRAVNGLLTTATVRENLNIAALRPFWRRLRLSKKAEQVEVKRWVDKLSVRSGGSETPIHNLSGGNQQKIVIARWLRTNPKVLILDEPTQGVDVGAKAEIYRFIEEAAKAGTAVLLCSTDLEELVRLSDEVIVMNRGRAVARLCERLVTVEEIEQWQLAEDSAALGPTERHQESIEEYT